MGYGRANSKKKANAIVEARLPIVAELYVKGWTLTRIADEVSARLNIRYSYSSASLDIKRLKTRWRESEVEALNEYLGESITRTKRVIKEAFDAWEKSNEDYNEETTTMQGTPIQRDGKTDVNTTSIEKTSRKVRGNGDAKYLDQVLKAQAELNKLLGLYAPAKNDITSNGNTLAGGLQIEIIDRREQVDNETANDKDISKAN